MEDKTMTYNKPEVVRVGSALAAVQSQGAKEVNPIVDSSLTSLVTPNAYEADE